MRKIAFFIAWILLSPAAFAGAPSPSFNCHNKLSPIETIICSDSQLSVLDSELAKIFDLAKKNNSQEKNYLIKDQRKWLKTRFQLCSYNGKDDTPAEDRMGEYIHCIQKLYEKRIKILSYPEFWPPLHEENVDKAIVSLRNMDPAELYNITTYVNRDILSEISCRFFEKDPIAAAKTFATYFGSSMDGWNPLCNKIDVADRVPEVRTLLDALKPIWGVNTNCEGTMRFAYGRSEMIIRILAAVDPDPMKNEIAIPPLDSAELGYTPDLKHWSQQGNWEKRQYEALQPLISNAQKALSQYYQTTFHTNKSDADSAAAFHITRIIREKTEHTGHSQTPSYMSLCYDKSDLDDYLISNTMPTKNCPYGEYVDMSKEATLRRFLGLAIVNQYPADVVKKLIADGAELSQKRKEFNSYRVVNDSPLMLAAPYPEMIDLLLKSGSDVNEQNAFGKTALMYAIQERNVKSVSLLLDANVDVNAHTSEDTNCGALKAGNRTPLMYAAWQGNSEIIKMIASAQANINAKDTNGEKAFDYLQHNETLTSLEKAELGKLLQILP